MKNAINAFINEKTLAIAGVSRDRMKWGNSLFRAISKKGYSVFPVNPNAGQINGKKCYAAVSEIPGKIENVIIALPSEKVMPVLKDCAKAGVKRVWLHQGAGKGAYSDEAVKFCRDNRLEPVYGVCPMMFYPKPGPHKIHYFFKKIFGLLPREFKTG